MAKRSRRKLLSDVAAGTAAVTGAAFLLEAPAARADPTPAVVTEAPKRTVHYVSESCRCLIATVLEEKDGILHLEYEQRPPTLGPSGRVYYYQRVQCRLHRVLDDDLPHPRPGTWHEADGCPCGRAYAEWIYGRTKKTEIPEPKALDENRRFALKRDGDMPCLVLAPTPDEIREMRAPWTQEEEALRDRQIREMKERLEDRERKRSA